MYRDQIVKVLAQVTGIAEPHLEHTQNLEHGDYASNVAMQQAKSVGKNPRELAEEYVKTLQESSSLKQIVAKIEVAGPGFINFYISDDALINVIKEIQLQKDQYGSSRSGEGTRWSIEHTSPNPNKAMHLGHLRNNVTGMAIANIWEFTGIEVIRDAVDNNRGIAIARLMWGYLKFANKNNDESADIEYWSSHQDEWFTPEEVGKRPDIFVDELYVKASEDFKNKDVEEKVRQLVVDWESENEKVLALWKKVLDYSYQGQQMTLERLGNKYDKIWHEHEHYKEGKELVERGLEQGVFRKTDEGTIITDLEGYGLTDTVVIKSDGTSLYITQDLALTKLKKEEFKADKLHWVIGPEQSLALKQLFAVCEQLGIGSLSDFVHISFGYMSIKGQGKMSSRAGNVVYIDQLIDQAKEKIMGILEKSDFSDAEKDVLAEKIAVGAIKYSILKVGRNQDTAFDFNESLSFEGNSGPYIQYTYARTQSIINKSEVGDSMSHETLGQEEQLLVRQLFRFSEVIDSASNLYSPNLVANYLFELAQMYNAFYNNNRILGSDREQARVVLTKAVGIVIKNGLNLLGISAPSKM